MARERLHKVLARAGISSRRRAEELIAEGRVTVNGMLVESMGVTVDPEKEDVRFDGERVMPERPAYFAVYKPKGVLSTADDDRGRPTVISLVEDRLGRRIYPVGRLEEDAEGLIIVTNDGDFAHRLTHAKFGVDRTYEIRVRGFIESEAIEKARNGVWLSTGKTAPIGVFLIKRSKEFSILKVVAKIGGDRDLRRLFAKLGHNVDRLVRTKIGTLTLSGLKRGGVRLLSPAEIKMLIERSDPGKKAETVRATRRARPDRFGPKDDGADQNKGRPRGEGSRFERPRGASGGRNDRGAPKGRSGPGERRSGPGDRRPKNSR